MIWLHLQQGVGSWFQIQKEIFTPSHSLLELYSLFIPQERKDALATFQKAIQSFFPGFQGYKGCQRHPEQTFEKTCAFMCLIQFTTFPSGSLT